MLLPVFVGLAKKYDNLYWKWPQHIIYDERGKYFYKLTIKQRCIRFLNSSLEKNTRQNGERITFKSLIFWWAWIPRIILRIVDTECYGNDIKVNQCMKWIQLTQLQQKCGLCLALTEHSVKSVNIINIDHASNDVHFWK